MWNRNQEKGKEEGWITQGLGDLQAFEGHLAL
jgi:hypothetical protein